LQSATVTNHEADYYALNEVHHFIRIALPTLSKFVGAAVPQVMEEPGAVPRLFSPINHVAFLATVYTLISDNVPLQ
jgi:hypothetical protein